MDQSGVIMRFGSGALADTVIYPDRTQRSVHPARRHESLTYRIIGDGELYHTDQGWAHYRYTFVYRFMGRTAQFALNCGELHGSPSAIDGIRAAFLDAGTVAYESFGASWAREYGFEVAEDPEEWKSARKMYRAAERISERLDRLFGDEGDRTKWEESVREK